MSSVAVLTPESFAEHRSGLKDQEITGNVRRSSTYLLTLVKRVSHQQPELVSYL